jgi:hypothetical protein
MNRANLMGHWLNQVRERNVEVTGKLTLKKPDANIILRKIGHRYRRRTEA